MAYVAFDLDSTLGCFVQVSPFIDYLYSPWALYEGRWSGRFGSKRVFPGAPLSPALRQKFKIALHVFVRCILKKEREGETHFLRPSLVPIAKRLSELKEAGAVVGVAIYSNNMNLGNLRFAAELIEQAAEIPPDLFCRFLHIYHPLRAYEVGYGSRGEILADKTPQTLYNGFVSGVNCSVKPKNYESFVKSLYFFDDVEHPYLISALGMRYFLVEPYEYHSASFESLWECFVKAFQISGLGDTQEYYQYNFHLFNTGDSSLKAIEQKLRKEFYQNKKSDSFPDDTELLEVFNLSFPLPVPPTPPVSKNEFAKALATLRRLETRKNRGEQLPPINQEALQTAERVISSYEVQNPEQAGGRRRGRKTRRRRRHGKRKV